LEQIQTYGKKNICLPSFTYEMKLNLENPKFLSDTKLIKRDDNNYYDDCDDEDKIQNTELTVNKFFQSFNIQIGYDPFYNKNFKFEISEKDIFIEKDFIFALINFEVLTDLNIPSISLNVITKNNWVKES